MKLRDLIGEHLLSGFDTEIQTLENGFDKYEEVRFVLDGITYKAVEDSDDGYRSYLKELEVSFEKISNTFPPQKVIGKMKENYDYVCNTDDVIQFLDVVTEKIVLEIGTGNTDDYYPYCVIHWYPENLAININR